MTAPVHISVVSPVYRAEKIVDELVRRNTEELSKITPHFEIILVDDFSPDKSWDKIEENCARDPRVKGVKLSRNFGQHCAVTAGVNHASGDCVVLMDCDLQDDPVHIHALYAEFKKGVDIVHTLRKKRKHNLRKAFGSWLFNLLFKLISNKNFDVNNGSLTLFSRKVSVAYCALKEKDQVYTQMLKWLGFRHSTITVEHAPRFEGESTYTFGRLMKMALQAWTAHSNRLLMLSVYAGFLLSIAAFAGIVLVVALWFTRGFLSGWASIATVILFGTGMVLITTGILGLYLGKTFEQSKGRPLFVIDEKINFDS